MNPVSDPDYELDASQLAALTHRAKRQIRQRMRTTRQAYPLAVIAEKSATIGERLLELPAVANARAVALFAPVKERREVDLQSLHERLRALGKTLYYPFLDPTESGFRTGFRQVGDWSELTTRDQVFAEPSPHGPEAARGDLDVVIVPALAVGTNGHRIGYGMGYYDATLPDVAPPAVSVVVAFDFQVLVELPHEAHDQPCDWIVTETRTFDVSRCDQAR